MSKVTQADIENLENNINNVQNNLESNLLGVQNSLQSNQDGLQKQINNLSQKKIDDNLMNNYDSSPNYLPQYFGGKIRISAFGCILPYTADDVNEIVKSYADELNEPRLKTTSRQARGRYPISDSDLNNEKNLQKFFDFIVGLDNDYILLNGDNGYNDALYVPFSEIKNKEDGTYEFQDTFYIGDGNYDLYVDGQRVTENWILPSGLVITPDFWEKEYLKNVDRTLDKFNHYFSKSGVDITSTEGKNIVLFNCDDHCTGTRSKKWGTFPTEFKNKVTSKYNEKFNIHNKTDLTKYDSGEITCEWFKEININIGSKASITKKLCWFALDGLYNVNYDAEIPYTMKEEQWEKLENLIKLKASFADLTIFSSGSPVIFATGDIPEIERRRILNLLNKYKVHPVLFTCGDLHYNNFNINYELGHGIPEVMTSGVMHVNYGSTVYERGTGFAQTYDIDFINGSISVINHMVNHLTGIYDSKNVANFQFKDLIPQYVNSIPVDGILINSLVKKAEYIPKDIIFTGHQINLNSVGYKLDNNIFSIQLKNNNSLYNLDFTNTYGFISIDLSKYALIILEIISNTTEVNCDLIVTLKEFNNKINESFEYLNAVKFLYENNEVKIIQSFVDLNLVSQSGISMELENPSSINNLVPHIFSGSLVSGTYEKVGELEDAADKFEFENNNYYLPKVTGNRFLYKFPSDWVNTNNRSKYVIIETLLIEEGKTSECDFSFFEFDFAQTTGNLGYYDDSTYYNNGNLNLLQNNGSIAIRGFADSRNLIYNKDYLNLPEFLGDVSQNYNKLYDAKNYLNGGKPTQIAIVIDNELKTLSILHKTDISQKFVTTSSVKFTDSLDFNVDCLQVSESRFTNTLSHRLVTFGTL